MQDLNVERIFVEQRRRGVAPVQAEATIILLDVAGPQLIAAQVEALENPGPRHDVNTLAVGDRRGGRHVLLALLVVAAAESLLPTHGPFSPVSAPEEEIISVR